MPPLLREDSSAKSDGQLEYVSHQQQKHYSFSENSRQDASQYSPDFHLSSETPNPIPLSSTTFDNRACQSSLVTDQEDTTDSDNNEPLWAGQPPLSLTPLKLLESLEQSFLETVLVDARYQPVAVLTGAVCVEALGNLIESPLASPNTDPSSPFMVSDNPLSTFASERLNHANVPLQTFEERLNASHVVIYDDDGKIGGTADRVARALRQSGRCQSSRHLEGGLQAWIHNFGNSLMDPAAWAVRDGIIVEEQPATEIQELRARQAKLVQAVWHTKPIPWSVFTGQCEEEFRDENGKERRKRLEQQIGADMQNNAPDGTIFPSALPEDDTVNKSLSAANENVEYDDGFGQFLSASSLSSPQQIVPFQDYPHEILPNLFLGGETTALEDRLRAFNIRQVVRIGWFWTPLVEGVRYFDYCLLDDISAANSIQRVIPQAVEAIACALEKGESVLVHCQAGVSRSATVILAYLMRYHSLTLRQAWDLVFRIRPIIRPNKGFAHVLLRYEEQLKAEGIIPSCIPLSSTVQFSKNTESQVPIPLYWVCESFDHYREYLEVEIRLRHIRRQLEDTHSCGKSPRSPLATMSSTSSAQSPSSTLFCPSPPPFYSPDQQSNKLVTQPETVDVLISVTEE